jgi:hypothetical protein
MSVVFASQNLLYFFHICTLVNEVSNYFRVDMMLEVEGMDMVEEQDHRQTTGWGGGYEYGG